MAVQRTAARRIDAYFNNDVEADAVRNAFALRELVGASPRSFSRGRDEYVIAARRLALSPGLMGAPR